MSVSKFGRREQEVTEATGGVSLAFLNDNYVKVDGSSTMLSHLNMGGSTVKNLSEPTQLKDAVTKNYVDTKSGHTFFNQDRTGNYQAAQTLNMANQKIINLPLPVGDTEPATKVYVDTSRDKIRREAEVYNPFTFQDDEYRAKDKLNMRGFAIENTASAVNPGDLTQLQDVKKLIPFESKNGSGGYEAKDHLYMGKKKLGGLRDPEVDREAANKGYVDREIKVLGDYSKKFYDGANYQIDGNFNLRKYRIFDVPTPTREDEVVNKKYVDGQIKKDIKKEIRRELKKQYTNPRILIRGEAEGPIIGRDAVLNSNARLNSFNIFGNVGLDDKGEIIETTKFYFGKYDGGQASIEAQFKSKKNVLSFYYLPFDGKVSKCYVYAIYDNNVILPGAGDHKEFSLDVSIHKKDENNIRIFNTVESYDSNYESKYNIQGEVEYNDFQASLLFDLNPTLNFKAGDKLSLDFLKSNPRIQRFIVTLVVEFE